MQPVNRTVFDAGRLWHGFVIGFVVLVLGLNCAPEWIAGRLNRKLKGESR